MVEKIAASVAATGAQGTGGTSDFAKELAQQAGQHGSSTPKSAFSTALQGPGESKRASPPGPASHGADAGRPVAPGRAAASPRGESVEATKQVRPQRPVATKAVESARSAAASAPLEKPSGAEILSEVKKAQHRLDQILKMAESGRTFSPAELLAFQAHTYRASQELEMASKVVEKGTSAVKQTLQTQI